MTKLPAGSILECLQAQRSDMVGLLRALARAESPSVVPETQGAVFALLEDQLSSLDYGVRRLRGRSSGGLLYARPRRRRHNGPLQLLLGHSDTVWPLGTLQEMPVSVDGNVLAGPGVYDMKAGLTQIVYALRALSMLGLEPSVTPLVLVNSDEEVGSADSRPTIRALARIVDRALVLEPSLGPTGKLKTARKGLLRYEVVVHGKAAHAGLAPEEGVSAILEVAHVIQKLFGLNDPQRGITVNVGAVNGGLRPNVIAPESRAQVDVRVASEEDARRIDQAIRQLKPVATGATICVAQVEQAPPMEPTLRNQRLWQRAQALGRELNLSLEEATSGGASDGNTTSQFTATLDGLGPVGGGAHARHEFIEIDSMIERCALLALLVLSPPDAASPEAGRRYL